MSAYQFEMEMCCDMQVRSLINELKLYKEAGETTARVLHARIPSAPSNESLFNCMMLFAAVDDSGKVELTGVVAFEQSGGQNTQKSVVIENFPDVDACLQWLKRGNKADYIASLL